MKKLLVYITVTLLAAACSRDEPAHQAESQLSNGGTIADTVYTNGNIYTVNDKQPWAEAFAIKDGKFIKVGSNAEVAGAQGDNTAVIDLKGAFVMPGLIDAHVHPLSVATNWANLQIDEPNNADAMLKQIKTYAMANPHAKMIRGEAWNLGVFPNDSPRKEVLDDIVKDRPVYLVSQTGHSAWVNSKALELAGITADTPNGGKFVFDTDPKTGEPSGTVREYAMGAIEQILPASPKDKYAHKLEEIFRAFNAYGHTALKAAEGEAPWLKGAAYLESQSGLSLRLFPSWHWRTHVSAYSPEQEDKNIAEWTQYQTERIYPRYIKIFYDGSPDSYSAVMYEAYLGRPSEKGKPHTPKDELTEVIAKFNGDGMGILVHVLGDAGARDVVDIFTEVRKRNGDNGVHLHLSHAWQTRPEEFTRLSQLADTCVDFSPALGYPADAIEGSMAPPLGEARYQQFFNVRSALEAGIPVGFGSDWASSLIPEPNAFHHIQSWITRADPDNPESGTLNAEQSVTLAQAVRGYTLGGAECLGFGWDEQLGSIETGKLADFIVLDRNIFEIPVEDLKDTLVERTIVAGEVVFDRDAAEKELKVIKVDITNKDLDNAVDAAALNLLIDDDFKGSGTGCLPSGADQHVQPGAKSAPGLVNQAFAALSSMGQRYARPAREIYWKKDDTNYWIQWTLTNDDTAVLWAYDPEAKKAVEVLRVSDQVEH